MGDEIVKFLRQNFDRLFLLNSKNINGDQRKGYWCQKWVERSLKSITPTLRTLEF
jgi:hypothetical protein